MSVTFRRGLRENVGLLVGLIGASGGGKTYTAMRLAKGIAGDKPFAVIDTEARRALHYADQFTFDHADLKAPFTPDAYAEAIAAADEAHYPVIVVDSASHEHAGVGGILDIQEAEFERLGRRDAVKMLSWVEPKKQHRKMVQRLLQVRAHLILCFRAEEKIEMVRGEGGKMEVRKKVTTSGIDGWVPICEKNLPYELTCSLLLLPDKPGVPQPIKLQEQHRHLFPLDRPITEESGRQLATWAAGGHAEGGRDRQGTIVKAPSVGETPPHSAPPDDERAALIEQAVTLLRELKPPLKDVQTWKETYLGSPSIDPRMCDVAALTDFVKYLQARAGKAA